MHSKDSGTDHVRVNLWLTLYKLTGWLASLDTTKTTSVAYLALHALYDVLVLDGGRGKTMRDLMDRDRKLPVNLAILNQTKDLDHQIVNEILFLQCAFEEPMIQPS